MDVRAAVPADRRRSERSRRATGNAPRLARDEPARADGAGAPPRSRSPASPTRATAVVPGALFFCVPGFKRRRARLRARRGRARRRGAGVRAPARTSACPRSSSTTCARRWGRPRRASTATRPRRCRSSASPARTARRRPPSSSAHLLEAAGMQTGLLGTVKRVVGGARRTGRAHDARGDRPPGHVPRGCSTAATGRARWRSPRTRSSWAAPTGSTSPCRVFTNLTQDHLDFHADDGGLLRGQAAAVRRARARGRERRRRVRPAAGRASCERRSPIGDRPRGRLPRARRPLRPRRLVASPARRRTGSELRDRRCPASSTSQNALAALAAARGARRRPDATAAAALAEAGRVPGPLRAGRRGPGLRRARRLRAHARLARERAARGARADRGPRCTSCSAPAATATAPSGR